ncbi:hypothetical protein EI77_01526 [Prosthecobacter fusiformis]|uniref:Antitoxin ParD1/3/4 n=1 Tax=Prosthecobacter fusiformis TaxID=48464 RepID=A0A4R7S5A5_9BACT|nr:hypothetical protein [Prosthecobacter fusiformis]TDU73059.1 hypothetical protein EI77_01526 [Prosthecobacter fusiformis]
MSQLAISLPDDLQSFVSEAVRSGRFTDEGDFVVNVLYQAMEQAPLNEATLDSQGLQKLEALRNDIRVGLDQLDRGEGISDFDWDAFIQGMHKNPVAAKSD